jgi:hypothetical protein
MTSCRLGKRWNLVWGAISALLVGLLVAGALSPNISMFAWVIAGFAALEALLVASQILRWRVRGRFESSELLLTLIVTLCGESAATAALLVVGAFVRSAAPLVAAAVTLLIVVAVCDVLVARRIRRFDSGFKKRRVVSGEHIDGAQPEPAPVLADERGGAAAADGAQNAARKRPSPRGLVPTAFRLVWAFLVGLGMVFSQWIAPIAVVGAMGVAVASFTGRLATPAPTGTSSSASAKTAGSGQSGGARAGKGSTNEGYVFEQKGSVSHDSPREAPRWNGPCGPPPKSHVSAEAIARMVRLFKVESQLEPSVEGCVGVIEAHPYPGDYYVTTKALETPSGETLSFAVYSELHGGVLVLDAARAKLEALIEKVGPVGGVGRYPHYTAGPGDYYLFRSALGVYVFIRESKTEPYRQLPPGLVRAWYLLMVTLETWLWPSHPLPGPHGKLIYEMWSPSNTRRPVAEVTLEPKSGSAYCARSVYHRSSRFEPSLGELVELSASA